MLVGFESKTAKAVCTMAYCAGPDTEPILFQGITTVSRDLACNF
jgi:inosine triphosphate pyrophosphatase